MKYRFALLVLCGVFLGACTAPPKGVEPVQGFDVERYLGKWFEVARLDHSFERGLSNVTAEYSMSGDGGVTVLNKGFARATCEESAAEGRAVFIGSSDIASLKVTFFWPFAGGYHVMALDKTDYAYALVAGPSFDYLWLLSRTPSLPADTQARLLLEAKAAGFDVSQLIFV
ncbi:MAG: lipocalin family protein, partial [Alphaproteobacteria bacterium]